MMCRQTKMQQLFKSFRLGALLAVLLAGVSSVCADSLTITYQDFTTPYLNSQTVNSPNGFGQYATSLSGSYGSVTYNVFGLANPPGSSLDSPGVAYLSTTGAQLSNISTTSHHIQITFLAETFTFPALGTVAVDSQINTNDMSGVDPSQSSQLTTSALDGLVFSRTAPVGQNDLGPVSGGNLTKTGSYRLLQIYDLWVVNTGAGTSVKVQMRMDISAPPGEAVPEPWTMAVLATMMPLALAYKYTRRRK